MSIKIGQPGAVSLFNVALSLYGDGASDRMVINLEQAPFSMQFDGNHPSDASAAYVTVYGAGNAVDPSYSATVSIAGQYLTVAFNKAPPSSASLVGATSQGHVTMNVSFAYQGAA